jgi:hypothetical protein
MCPQIHMLNNIHAFPVQSQLGIEKLIILPLSPQTFEAQRNSNTKIFITCRQEKLMFISTHKNCRRHCQSGTINDRWICIIIYSHWNE